MFYVVAVDIGRFCTKVKYFLLHCDIISGEDFSSLHKEQFGEWVVHVFLGELLLHVRLASLCRCLGFEFQISKVHSLF